MQYAHPYCPVQREQRDEREDHVLQTLFLNLTKKIIKEKCAFLLHELLQDISYANEEVGLDAPIISDTRSHRRKIEEEFGEHISFRSASIYVLVYASDTNPCDYAVATLRGQGLRDDDLIRAFGRMIRRRLQCRDEQPTKLPLTAEEFFLELDRGPPPDLYNAIFYTIKDDAKKYVFSSRLLQYLLNIILKVEKSHS